MVFGSHSEHEIIKSQIPICERKTMQNPRKGQRRKSRSIRIESRNKNYLDLT